MRLSKHRRSKQRHGHLLLVQRCTSYPRLETRYSGCARSILASPGYLGPQWCSFALEPLQAIFLPPLLLRLARRYLLSCARKAGCAILLGWEDVMAARPNLMLLLVASFMALDMDRRPPGQQHPQQQ